MRVTAGDAGQHIRVAFDGRALLSIERDGVLAWFDSQAVIPSDTPDVQSPEFAAGRERFRRVVAWLAKRWRAAMARRARARSRSRPRARSRRSPRVSRAGPSDPDLADDPEPPRRRPHGESREREFL